MSVFRCLYLKMPFYSKLMFPSKDCLADFRWQSIDFVDALSTMASRIGAIVLFFTQ